MTEKTEKVTPKDHALSVAVVLFILAAFCFRDVSVSEDDLFMLPGIGLAIGGLYAVRRWHRLGRS